MKIFLSSTAYDLFDIRALAVEGIRATGHMALHHETPAFTTRRGLHSHDMCVLAVEDADAVLCIIDKRYGSTYAGNFATLFPQQTFQIRGHKRNGKAESINITVPTNSLSITWCELIHAYKLGKQVITFVRSRTLDEKMTRRRNQFVKNFKPAYAERNEIFDLLDWITKQRIDNYIVPFYSAVDFDEKLHDWLRRIDSSTVPPGAGPPGPAAPGGGPPPTGSEGSIPPVTVIVEGPSDRTVITTVATALNLPARVDVVTAFGKTTLLRNVTMFLRAFEASGAVVFLADADTYSEGAIEATKLAFHARVKGKDRDRTYLCLAVPQTEAWLWQAIDPRGFQERKGVERVMRWKQGLDIPRAMEALAQNIDRVARELPDFADFVEKLRIAAAQAVNSRPAEDNG